MKDPVDISEATEIQLATDSEQIRSCYGIMRQLRPQLASEEDFANQIHRQIKEGYRLAYIHHNGRIGALAGFRFLEFLAWGKVLYIDDLVSDAATRRNGYGGKILKWVIGEAKKAKCDQVHLDSGPQRHDAHRFYLNHGFKITGHHFSLALKEQL